MHICLRHVACLFLLHAKYEKSKMSAKLINDSFYCELKLNNIIFSLAIKKKRE